MAAQQKGNMSIWRVVQISWTLLSVRGKRHAVLIAIASIFVSLLDTIALVGVMPLVSLIVDPDVITTNQAIRTIHEFMGAPEFDTFVKMVAAAAIGLIALSFGMNYFMMVVNKRFRVTCQNRLARELIERCVSAPYAWLLRQNSATLAHHVSTDVQHWSTSVQRTMTMIAQSSLLILVACVVLTAAALPGLIAMLIVGVLAVSVMLLTRSRIRRLSVLQRTAAARAFSVASEFLGGIKDVKLTSRENTFVRAYCDAFNTVGETLGVLKLFQAIPPLVMMFLGQVGIIFIALALWGLGKSSGEIAAEMALVLLVTARIVPAISRLGGEFSAMWSIISAVEGINALLKQLPPLIESRPDKAENAALRDWQRIELIDLGYRYSSEQAIAVQGIRATLERGKSYGIVGPTGAGKTTFVDLLLGLLHPSGGEIEVDGIPLNHENARMWQSGIGYVPQSPLIADDTLRANVAFGVPAGEVDEAKVLHCLEMTNLGDVVEAVTLGGGLGEHGDRLSGGQRQRVAIARALYDEPNLLVLDEATSSLDTLSERAIQAALENLRGIVTTVTIAHRFSTVKKCDEIFVIEHGQLVARGRYDDLMRTSKLFASMAMPGNEEDGAFTEPAKKRKAAR